MASFRGKKKVRPRPDWSPLGFNSKNLTSLPAPFLWEFPRDGTYGEIINHLQSTNSLSLYIFNRSCDDEYYIFLGAQSKCFDLCMSSDLL